MSYFKIPAGANAKIYDINQESPQRAVWRIRIPAGDTAPITLVDGAGLVVTSNNPGVVPQNPPESSPAAGRTFQLFGQAVGTSMLEARDGTGAVKTYLQICVQEAEGGPEFIKPAGSSLAGSHFTDSHKFWRQEMGVGGTTRVGIRNPGISTIGLNNPSLASLVIYKNQQQWLIDITAMKAGDAMLEAKVGEVVVAYLQIHVGSEPDATTPYVDDFSEAFYRFDYRKEGEKGLSKWLTLLYWDNVVLDIHLDKILEGPEPTEQNRRLQQPVSVGEGARKWPAVLNRTTTPRLYAAKQQALEAMGEYNLLMMETAFQAVYFIITINPFVASENRIPRGTRQRITGSPGPKLGGKTPPPADPVPPPKPSPIPCDGPVYRHSLNKGGIEDILASQRLKATPAANVAGGGSAVRAFIGPWRIEPGKPPADICIEFTTNVKGSPRPFYGMPGMEWTIEEGEYLAIRVLKVFYPDGRIVTYD